MRSTNLLSFDMANIFPPKGMNYNDIDEKKISWSSSMRHGDKWCQWQSDSDWSKLSFEALKKKDKLAEDERQKAEGGEKVASWKCISLLDSEKLKRKLPGKRNELKSEVKSGQAIGREDARQASMQAFGSWSTMAHACFSESHWVILGQLANNSFLTVGQEAAESLKRDADVDRKKIEVWRYQSINSMVSYQTRKFATSKQ